MPGEPPLRARAWAKINLYLHVLARRDDGYHELDSLIVFAGAGDVLEVEPANKLTLAVCGPFTAGVTGDERNLVMRAARLLAGGSKSHGATMRLHKHLPHAAGIGGGSADAAAALKLLNGLWDCGHRASELRRLGLELGADLPVCLFARPAFVGGIGERIERAPPLPPVWLVLANPMVALPTPDVFRARRGEFSQPGRFLEPPRDAASLAALLAARRNDLEDAARSFAPEVGRTLDRLRELEGCLLARMSGSGATCFGIFAERDEAKAAADGLRKIEPSWWVEAAPMLHGPHAL